MKPGHAIMILSLIVLATIASGCPGQEIEGNNTSAADHATMPVVNASTTASPTPVDDPGNVMVLYTGPSK